MSYLFSLFADCGGRTECLHDQLGERSNVWGSLLKQWVWVCHCYLNHNMTTFKAHKCHTSLLNWIFRDIVPDVRAYTRCAQFRISTHPFLSWIQFQTMGSTVTRIRSTCCVNITSNTLASSPSPTILSTPKSATWFLHCRWYLELGPHYWRSHIFNPTIFRALQKSSLCWSKTISESIIQVFIFRLSIRWIKKKFTAGKKDLLEYEIQEWKVFIDNSGDMSVAEVKIVFRR